MPATLSPFAFVQEMRGNGSTGRSRCRARSPTARAILAAQAMGADLAYIGSAFIATQEANAVEGYKQMIVESARGHRLFQPVHRRARQLSAPSIVAAGLDPDNLPQPIRRR
jgi:nitronate monooxygenase